MTTIDLTTRFTTIQNFGYSLRTQAYALRPTRPEEIAEAFRFARQNGLTVAVRGAGRSYNDVAHNGGGIVLDLTAMNRILNWDPPAARSWQSPVSRFNSSGSGSSPMAGGPRWFPAPC